MRSSRSARTEWLRGHEVLQPKENRDAVESSTAAVDGRGDHSRSPPRCRACASAGDQRTRHGIQRRVVQRGPAGGAGSEHRRADYRDARRRHVHGAEPLEPPRRQQHRYDLQHHHRGGRQQPDPPELLLATGGAGKTSLLSVGEIDPFFGGTGLPYLVAYQLNGATLPSPILVVPQDTTRSRFVTGLDQLVIATVPMAPQGPRSVTQSFTLSGVAMPSTFTTADLAPPTTVSNVTFLSGNTPTGPNSYTGVDLWNFLVAAGLLSNPLNSYVLATGSDGFRVLFSLAELDPAFGARTDLLADSIDGGAPGTSLGS